MNCLALGRLGNDFEEREETLKNGETKTKLVKDGTKFKAGGGESFGYACCWIVDPLTLIWNELLDSFQQKLGYIPVDNPPSSKLCRDPSFWASVGSEVVECQARDTCDSGKILIECKQASVVFESDRCNHSIDRREGNPPCTRCSVDRGRLPISSKAFGL
jgi:hypothetical protein